MRLVLIMLFGGLLARTAFCVQTPAAVAAELRGIEQDLNPYTLAGHQRDLPAGWDVQTSDGKYSISAAPLRTLLQNRSEEPAKLWLGAHAAQLESLGGPTIAQGSARAALSRILTQKEFAPPRPKSYLEKLRDLFNQWLAHLIERLFGQISKYPVTGNIVFWAALAGAVGLLAYWLITLFEIRPGGLKLTGSQQVTVSQTSSQWLAALNAARERGDLRTAVQCAYWAGIARLQDTGALPGSIPETPREYLRSAEPPVLGPLRKLTSSLERFWYGCAEASQVDLAACLQSLEELGCRWD